MQKETGESTAAKATEIYQGVREIQARLGRLERREWFLWWSVVVVMLLLTTAVVSFSFPEVLRETDWFSQLQLSQSVRALVGLVLIFNIYTIHQHIQIRNLRNQLSAQMTELKDLETRADEFYVLAVQDHLTGLYNRRFADERLANEIRRAERHGHPLTVVVLDLNDFKEINDRYGHATGDLVLRDFAARLQKAVRSTDLAARLGGDEFLALLPECPSENAHLLLQRIGPLETLVDNRKMTLSFSAGVAGYEKGDSAEDLLDRADRALYTQKKTRKPGKTFPVQV